jgi:hypothetical protein
MARRHLTPGWSADVRPRNGLMRVNSAANASGVGVIFSVCETTTDDRQDILDPMVEFADSKAALLGRLALGNIARDHEAPRPSVTFPHRRIVADTDRPAVLAGPE